MQELIEWVRLDQTYKHTYDPEKFQCGDFTIMLIQHAKEKNWRMLFTVIEFDYIWQNPNGTRRHHGMLCILVENELPLAIEGFSFYPFSVVAENA